MDCKRLACPKLAAVLVLGLLAGFPVHLRHALAGRKLVHPGWPSAGQVIMGRAGRGRRRRGALRWRCGTRRRAGAARLWCTRGRWSGGTCAWGTWCAATCHTGNNNLRALRCGPDLAPCRQRQPLWEKGAPQGSCEQGWPHGPSRLTGCGQQQAPNHLGCSVWWQSTGML